MSPIYHRHAWFTEQQTGHKWCHMCGDHAPDSRGNCHQWPLCPNSDDCREHRRDWDYWSAAEDATWD